MRSRLFKQIKTDESAKPPIVCNLPELAFSHIEYLKQVPQNELYRFIVDGYLHKNEYGWLGYANREEGSVDAAFNGLTLAFSDLNLLMSTQYIQKMHYACGAYLNKYGQVSVVGNKPLFPGQLRKSPGGFYLFDYALRYSRNNFLSELGFYEFYDEFLVRYKKYGAQLVEVKENDSAEHSCHNRLDLCVSEKTKEELWRIINEGGELYYRAPDYQHLALLLDNCCDEFNRDILFASTQEGKLTIIIRFVKEVELIHAFNDFNGRTSLMLLQRLLIQNGFLPVMLFDPNYIDGYSSAELLQEIKQGMNNTLSIIKHPNQPLFGFSSSMIDIEIHRLLNINKTYSAMAYMAPEVSRHPNYEGPSHYAMALHASRGRRVCLMVTKAVSPLLNSKLLMIDALYVRTPDELHFLQKGILKKIEMDAKALQHFDELIPVQLKGLSYIEQAPTKMRVLTEQELQVIEKITQQKLTIEESREKVLYNFIQELDDHAMYLSSSTNEIASSSRPF